MIDITLENFQTELIDGSLDTPVLLDIWAEWCGPCRQLGPVLEKLETEYAGRFKLAKLDADRVPEIAGQLSQMFGVRSIPFCVMFVQGQPVDGFVGALPADKVREFLDKHVAPAGEQPPAQDEAPPAPLDADAQIDKLAKAAADKPDDDAARFDWVRALITAGRHEQARAAFAPAAAKAGVVRRLGSLQIALDAIEFAAAQADPKRLLADLDAKIAANKRDFAARHDRARLLAGSHRWTEAMDELLEILMRDKAWSEDAARKLYVAILDVIEPPRPKVADGQIPPDDPTVASYRRRLSSVVLS